jgi:hypothetical protein
MKPAFSVNNVNNTPLSGMAYSNNTTVAEINNLRLPLCDIAFQRPTSILQASSIVNEEKRKRNLCENTPGRLGAQFVPTIH